MTPEEIATTAAYAVAAYALYKVFTSRARAEQIIGKAEASAKQLQGYDATSAQGGTLDPQKLLLRSVEDGQLTTYKINPLDLNIYQRLAVERGWYTISGGVLKPDIPYVPVI